jgi:hypothetical protein
LQPFEETFDGSSCHGVETRVFDREGDETDCCSCGYLCPFTLANYICYEAQIVTFNDIEFTGGPTKALASLVPPLSLPDSFGLTGETLPSAGNLQLSFSDTVEQLRPAASGLALSGLPAIGFAAINYVNANVTPGLLSNYSAVYPHRSSVQTCPDAGIACP